MLLEGGGIARRDLCLCAGCGRQKGWDIACKLCCRSGSCHRLGLDGLLCLAVPLQHWGHCLLMGRAASTSSTDRGLVSTVVGTLLLALGAAGELLYQLLDGGLKFTGLHCGLRLGAARLSVMLGQGLGSSIGLHWGVWLG